MEQTFDEDGLRWFPYVAVELSTHVGIHFVVTGKWCCLLRPWQVSCLRCYSLLRSAVLYVKHRSRFHHYDGQQTLGVLISGQQTDVECKQFLCVRCYSLLNANNFCVSVVIPRLRVLLFTSNLYRGFTIMVVNKTLWVLISGQQTGVECKQFSCVSCYSLFTSAVVYVKHISRFHN